MGQMNISNTLFNDTDTGTLAYVEQLKDRLLKNYIATLSQKDQGRIPTYLKAVSGVFQERLNEFFLQHWVDFQRFLLDEGVDPDTIDSWYEVKRFLEGLDDDTAMWLKNKLADIDYYIYELPNLDGGAFDISAAHSGSQYANLSAALLAIPSEAKKSGMSIRFLNTNDKYELWHYTLEYDSTDADSVAAFNVTTNWFGIDEIPTENSNNLVRSGSVYDAYAHQVYLEDDSSVSPVPEKTIENDTVWNTSGSQVISAANQKAIRDNIGVTNELALGGVYDVSAHNNGTTFASLSALLSDANLSTLIPVGVRKGGMAIKFVQTSDNKYVQYRYMGTATTGNPNPFLDTANWQGVDVTPTSGSHNLVESEGTITTIWNFDNIVDVIIDGSVWKVGTSRKSLIVPCPEGSYVRIKSNSDYPSYYGFITEKNIANGKHVLFTSGETLRTLNANKIKVVVAPQGTNYLVVRYGVTAEYPERYKPEIAEINGRDILKNFANSIANEVSDDRNLLDSVLPVYDRSVIYGTLTPQDKWDIPEASTAKYILLKVKGGVKAQIIASTSNGCIGCFLKSLPEHFIAGMDMSTYYATVGTSNIGRVGYTQTSVPFTTPTDAKYLILSLVINSADWTPAKVMIDNIDFSKTVYENIDGAFVSAETANSKIDKIINPVITFTQIKIHDLYINKEFYDDEAVESITSATFYRKYQSSTGYVVGLLFRDSNSQTVVDGRISLISETVADSILNNGYIALPHIKYSFSIGDSPIGDVYTTYVTLSEDVLEIFNSKEINYTVNSELIYNKEQKIEIEEAVANKLINLNGEVQSTSASISISKPFNLTPGDKISVYCTSSTIASVLSLVTDSGYISICAGSSDYSCYSYIADDFCQVVISYNYNKDSFAEIIGSEFYTIEPSLVFTPNMFVAWGGTVVGSSSALYGVSNIIKVYSGDNIKLRIAATHGVTAVLSSCDEHGAIIDSIYTPTTDTYEDYEYDVKSNGHILISGNFNTVIPPKLTIIRKKSVLLFDKMHENQIKQTKYIREKYNYFDNKNSAIPENYGSILTYDGDVKNNRSSNFIVNAVSRKDGTIIACRDGGDVVKISNNGTETTLGSVPGSGDWRGMFVDSQDNVFVSPHRSTGGGSADLSYADRGIWKISHDDPFLVQKLKLYYSPEECGLSIEIYKSGTKTFVSGNLYYYDNVLYTCTEGYTGTSFELSNFVEYVISAWQSGTAYVKGDIRKVNNTRWTCIEDHTSSTTFDDTKWCPLVACMESDDTIWTFCEDYMGNLYAGVYAHSSRANPSVYKSEDSGETWHLVSNLLEDGYCKSTAQYDTAMHIHCIIYNKYDKALYCLVGEIETVFKSTDYGKTWEDLHIIVEDAKGTTLIAVPDGVLIGSDGTKKGIISKMYSDNHSVKTVGRMWHAEFFGMRQSDITGWIYAFTKIESNIGQVSVYPPIAANTDPTVLNNWKSNTSAGVVKNWEMYHDWVAANYTHDSIHPTSAAILVSKDNGETWEVIYKRDTNTGSGIGMGIYCVGYFRNGECLCGMTVETNGVKKFTNPVIISEGNHKYTQDGIDLSGDIMIKTNSSQFVE